MSHSYTYTCIVNVDMSMNTPTHTIILARTYTFIHTQAHTMYHIVKCGQGKTSATNLWMHFGFGKLSQVRVLSSSNVLNGENFPNLQIIANLPTSSVT